VTKEDKKPKKSAPEKAEKSGKPKEARPSSKTGTKEEK
jgi:hypothetical protein